MTRIALVPGVPALLPANASVTDPVADVRAACAAAVDWLGGEVVVHADGVGEAVAVVLLAEAGATRVAQGDAHLVVGNGSATVAVHGPDRADPRGPAFDDALRAALERCDVAVLKALDLDVADALHADVSQLAVVADLLAIAGPADVTYDDSPYGVRYWVMRWESMRPSSS